jgi:hypothetical protein
MIRSTSGSGTLARQFGEQYQAYRRAVPAWRPRARPWHQGQPE